MNLARPLPPLVHSPYPGPKIVPTVRAVIRGSHRMLPAQRRGRRGLRSGVLLTVVVLGGCVQGPPEASGTLPPLPSATPSSPSATAGATPTSDPPTGPDPSASGQPAPPPAPPGPATSPSPRPFVDPAEPEVQAAAVRFFQAWDEAYRTGDTGPLLAASTTTCQGCRRLADILGDFAAKGVVSGLEVSAVPQEVRAFNKDIDQYSVFMTVSITAGQVADGGGTVLEAIDKQEPTPTEVLVEREGNQWLVAAYRSV